MNKKELTEPGAPLNEVAISRSFLFLAPFALSQNLRSPLQPPCRRSGIG